MRGRVHIGSIFNLDSFCCTLCQSPKLSLDITLGDLDLAKCSMQLVNRRWTGAMCIPPREGECSISSLEGRDRVLVSFLEPEIIALGEQAGRAEPFLIGGDGGQRRVKAIYVESWYSAHIQAELFYSTHLDRIRRTGGSCWRHARDGISHTHLL
jgi:hypothetical protein